MSTRRRPLFSTNPAKTGINGNILTSKADLIVIPVNCVGVAGKGLAKQWGNLDPDNLPIYRHWCEEGRLVLGHPMLLGRWVLFPTKFHWKNDSKLQWIIYGLQHMARMLGGDWIYGTHLFNKLRVTIAVPYLGCGEGGLDKEKFRNVLDTFLPKFPSHVHFELWEYDLEEND